MGGARSISATQRQMPPSCLGNEALGCFLAVAHSSGPLGKVCTSRHKWHPRFDAQAMQVAFALDQGQATQIEAVLVEEVKDQEHQLAFVRRTRAHLCHQPVEVRGAAGIDQAQLAVEDRRARREPCEGLDHARKTVGVFSTVARIQPNRAAILDDLEAKPIPFGFVDPIVALWWAGRGGQGADERETYWHGTVGLRQGVVVPIM